MQEAFYFGAPATVRRTGRLREGCGPGMPGPYKGGGCLTTRSRPLSAAPRLRPSWPSWCIRARRCGACRACPCGSWRRSRPACCTTRRAGQRTAGSSVGDSERLPFEDSSFDAIVCNDSFHHYPQPDIVEKEVSRCLKQNGVFIIGDCWQPIGARQIMNYYMKHSNSGDVKIYSKKEMLLLLSKDFHEIEWKSFGTRSCLIIAYNN